jgi:nucleotide-binding universal stress UspA family protein
LVGYDGSQDSYAALRLGAMEALTRDADLILVNAVDDIVLGSAWGVVADPEQVKAAAQDALRDGIAKALAEGLPLERIRTDVIVGKPAAQLAKLSEKVNLVVVGRKAIESLRPYTGSTTLGLAGTTRCPMIVTSSSHPLPKDGWDQVVVGVDVSRNRGRVALNWGYDLADASEGALTALGIVKEAGGRWFSGQELTPSQIDKAVAGTREKIAALVEPYEDANPDVETSIEVRYGDPLKELVEASKTADILLLEVQSAFPAYAIGAVARGLMTYSNCPVGLVRSREQYAG